MAGDKNSVIDVQVGTLGGGNHFIELDRDEETGKFIWLFTCSRNIGKQSPNTIKDCRARMQSRCTQTAQILTGEEATNA